MTDVRLGLEYRCRITGFTGIAVSMTVYMWGCDRVGLQAKSIDSKAGNVEFFDTKQVIATGGKMEGYEEPTLPLLPDKPGGPQPEPRGPHTPK